MELDDATKNLAEANAFLNPDTRNKMKSESYLGELTDISILNQAAEKADKWLPILKKYHPGNTTFDDLPKKIQKELQKLLPKPKPKPVVIKTEPEPEKVVEKVVEKEEPVKKPRQRANAKYPYLRKGGK